MEYVRKLPSNGSRSLYGVVMRIQMLENCCLTDPEIGDKWLVIIDDYKQTWTDIGYLNNKSNKWITKSSNFLENRDMTSFENYYTPESWKMTTPSADEVFLALL